MKCCRYGMKKEMKIPFSLPSVSWNRFTDKAAHPYVRHSRLEKTRTGDSCCKISKCPPVWRQHDEIQMPIIWEVKTGKRQSPCRLWTKKFWRFRATHQSQLCQLSLECIGHVVKTVLVYLRPSGTPASASPTILLDQNPTDLLFVGLEH